MEREEFKESGKNKKKVMSKADVIRASKLPEAKKIEYLKEIGELKEEFDPTKVTFSVYAAARNIQKHRQKAMLVYPPAQKVQLASLNEWDEIFKNF